MLTQTLWWKNDFNALHIYAFLVKARNYRFYRNANFCKGTKLAKSVRGLKSMPLSYNKKVRWFFPHVSNGKFAAFCVLFWGTSCKWVLFLYALEYIIDLLTRAHLRLAAELPCLCLTLETASLCSGFFVHRRFIFLSRVATSRSV